MKTHFRKRCSGLGLIGWIITIPLVFIALLMLVVGFFEGRKAYWNHKVTEMCEKDGGVKVYEHIELSRREYPTLISSSGNVIIPNLSNAKPNDPYYVTFSEIIIREKNPKVRKTETKIIRHSDSKVLSLRVSYSRGGGDIPTGILAPSSFSCRSLGDINTSLIESTFSVEGDHK